MTNKTMSQLIAEIASNKAAIKQFTMQMVRDTETKEQAISLDESLSPSGRATKREQLRNENKQQAVAFIGAKVKASKKAQTQLHELAISNAANALDAQLEDTPQAKLFAHSLKQAEFNAATAVNKSAAVDEYKALADKHDSSAEQLAIQSSLQKHVGLFAGDADAMRDVVRLNNSIEHAVKNADEETALSFELLGGAIDGLPVDIDRSQRDNSELSYLKRVLNHADIAEIEKDRDYFVNVEDTQEDDVQDNEPQMDEDEPQADELQTMLQTIAADDATAEGEGGDAL